MDDSGAFRAGPLHIKRALLLPNTASTGSKPPTVSPFVKPCRDGDADGVVLLLQRGHHPDEHDRNGSTPLMHAVWHASPANDNNLAIAAALVEAGADVNAHNVRLNTALHFAYERHNLVLVDWLLAHGAKASEDKRNGLGLLPRQLVPCENPIKQYIQEALKDLPHTLVAEEVERPTTSSGRLRRYINRTAMCAADGFSLADVFDAADLDNDRQISVQHELPVALRAVGLRWDEGMARSYAHGGVRALQRYVQTGCEPIPVELPSIAATAGTSDDAGRGQGPGASPHVAATRADFTTFCRLVQVLQPTLGRSPKSTTSGSSPVGLRRPSGSSPKRSLRRSASEEPSASLGAPKVAPPSPSHVWTAQRAAAKNLWQDLKEVKTPPPVMGAAGSRARRRSGGSGSGRSPSSHARPTIHASASASALSSTSLTSPSDRPGTAVMRAHLRHNSGFNLDALPVIEAPEYEPTHVVHLHGRMPKHAVFLGGACNPTTWRRDTAMPMLEDAGITYYNPQVDEWYPELIAVEEAAKSSALVVFFVVSSETRAVASMVEASELIASGRNVVLVLQDVPPRAVMGGVTLSANEIKDLNRGRAYLANVASRKGFPVYQSISAGVEEVIRRFSGAPPSPDDSSP